MALADTWYLMALGRGLTGVGIGLSAVAAPAYLGRWRRRACAAPSWVYMRALCVGLLVPPRSIRAARHAAAAITPLLPGWRPPLCAPARWARVLVGAPCLPPSPDHGPRRPLRRRLRSRPPRGRPHRRASGRRHRVSSLSRFSSTRTTPLEGRPPPRRAARARATWRRSTRRALDALLSQAERSAARAPAPFGGLCAAAATRRLVDLCLAVVNQANGSSTLLNYISDVIGAAGAAGRGRDRLHRSRRREASRGGGGTALIDAVGRRPLLLAGALGSAAALGALATAISAGSLAATIAALAAFMLVYAVSLAPIFFVLLSELFSDDASHSPPASRRRSPRRAPRRLLLPQPRRRHRTRRRLEVAGRRLPGRRRRRPLMLPETKGKSLLEVQRLMAPRRAPPAATPQSAGASDDEEEAEEDENEETRRMLVGRRSSPWILAA